MTPFRSHAPAGVVRIVFAALLVWIASSALPLHAQDARRPMTFLDMKLMRSIEDPAPSPDRRWMLYVLSIPDWEEGRSQTDLFLVSMRDGVSSTRQMTFTEKNEGSPGWGPDSRMFFFLSNREAPADASSRQQLYVMRPDGGEARRLTSAPDGVRDYAISRDGRWIVYRAGKNGEEQLYRLPLDRLEDAEPEQITTHDTGVGRWRWAPDSTRIYFVSPDAIDRDDKTRREKKFTVNIRNMETPSVSLWSLDLGSRATKKLTDGTQYAVGDFTVSPDGRWIGFRGHSLNRYHRNITQETLYADLYLLDAASGEIERLTDNVEVAESEISFSPDGRWIAFSASNDMSGYNMDNRRVYLRAAADRHRSFRKLGESFDGDVSIEFWSDDGRTIYFNEGIRATTQVLALDIESGAVRQVTREQAALSASRDDRSGAVLINYQDPKTPETIFTVDSLDALGTRSAWRQLTDANPQVRSFLLGEEEEITWRSTDGSMVGGVLVKPVGYTPGRRYPLIVAIHGGPASADVLRFNGGYGAQVYAGDGYVVLKPNYRGSTNYGVKHKTDIVGNYFPPGFEDIMSGVDHLIAQGVVDPDRMGVLGWSAGGHWSNWILTHTDRFKAISSGAGTSNWISMYAQSDVQRNRQYYLGDKLPYDDFDAYWNQSPLKYIKNARTPTMIHVVEGDPRVPSPQSVELHMALKQLGVPTELFMYPGDTHGIPDARNRLVKEMSEKAWMDYYVRGVGEKFSWRMVLETLESDAKRAATDATPQPQR